eukprot:scaffold15885_cov127-Isochrysis_galbana.AAC.4
MLRRSRCGGSPWPRRRCWRRGGAISRRVSGWPRDWRRINDKGRKRAPSPSPSAQLGVPVGSSRKRVGV